MIIKRSIYLSAQCKSSLVIQSIRNSECLPAKQSSQVTVSPLVVSWDNTFAVLGAVRELSSLHLIHATLGDGIILRDTGRLS